MNTLSPKYPSGIGLIGGLEKRDIVIHEYSNAWPEKFQFHKNIIVNALGPIALALEHIGSTAVPGLAAKPIVDILLLVSNPAKEDGYLAALTNAGYQLRVREPDFDEHRMLRTTSKDVHIHIFSPNSKEIGRYLAFRNHLRQNATDRLRYEVLKRSLALRDWQDVNDYAQAKSEFVEAIIGLAMRR